MPLYEIEHSLPLSVYQKEILAKRITSIHSRLFTTPSLFVNIRFLDKSGSEHFNFVGGKRVGFQLLLPTVLCARSRRFPPDTLTENEISFVV